MFNKDGTDGSIPSSSREPVEVGRVFRVKLPDVPKATRRVVVLDTDKDSGAAGAAVSVMRWEREAPTPIVEYSSPASNKGIPLRRPLILPKILPQSKENENEWTVALSNLHDLLPFESELSNSAESGQVSRQIQALDALILKERGDQLLGIGDASVAAGYYESALQLSVGLSCQNDDSPREPPRMTVGSTVIVRVEGGHVKIAEVDVINDSTSIEVSMDTGQESTMHPSCVLFLVSEDDDGRVFQVRTLLNLARCLNQLAATATSITVQLPETSMGYLKSAVLACTLALTILSMDSFCGDNSGKLLQSALLLRSTVYISLQKLPHARADIQRLLATDQNHKEGLRISQQLTRLEAERSQSDRRLVKDMCRWVQTATAASDDASESVSAPILSLPRKEFDATKTRVKAESTNFVHSLLPYLSLKNWFVVIMAIVVGLFCFKTNPS
jgi:hypothetical protein